MNGIKKLIEILIKIDGEIYGKCGCSVAVHLRIREVDQLIPKSLYPTTSGNTYWQVEAESSVLNGNT